MRVRAQIRDVQAGQLRAAQPERVTGLDQLRVAQRRESALPARGSDPLDPIVGVVEQPLHLLIGQRAPFRAALVVVEMGHGVPLVTHLRGHRVEPVTALTRPFVAGVGDVVAEHPQRQVVAADRRRRQLRCARRQRDGEVLDVRRRPRPRVGLREISEAAHQRQPGIDRRLAQHPRLLLPLPARDHALEHRRRLIQMHHAVDQDQPDRPRNLARQPAPACQRKSDNVLLP